MTIILVIVGIKNKFVTVAAAHYNVIIIDMHNTRNYK